MTNGEAYDQVVREARACLGDSYGRNVRWIAGPLEVNDFSFCIAMLQKDPTDAGVYVKIPKREISKSTVWPISDEDREMGDAEYQSLRLLQRTWSGDRTGVAFVRPVGRLKKWNAVITERAVGDSFYERLVRDDLQGRFTGNRSLVEACARWGKALRGFHEAAGRTTEADITPFVRKLRSYEARLDDAGVPKTVLQNVERVVEALGELTDTPLEYADSLKGLDIRNAIIDSAGHLHLFDPGKTTWQPIVIDLARLIMTLRLTYWGRLPFFGRMAPHRDYEAAFWCGYGDEDIEGRLLMPAWVFREALRMWLILIDAVRLKPWPRGMKKFIRKTYLDPFFLQLTSAECRRAEELARRSRGLRV